MLAEYFAHYLTFHLAFPRVVYIYKTLFDISVYIIGTFVSGGWTGILGGTCFKVCRPLQNALRRCPGTAWGATAPRNKCLTENAQHSAHHQSFTAHLRAREILGEPLFSFFFDFIPLSLPPPLLFSVSFSLSLFPRFLSQPSC